MQVKKFEAKSMQEALELVKSDLGPEAIILSARDTHRGFGLIGEKSVEVTAAVTEETLRKKRVAESKLGQDIRERFKSIPAAQQKEFINRVFKKSNAPSRELAMVGEEVQRYGKESTTTSKARRPQPVIHRPPVTGTRYIDIGEEEAPQLSGRDRVRRAALQARQASQAVLADAAAAAQAPTPAARAPKLSAETLALDFQVKELKSLIEKFQSMPQVPLSLHPGADQGLPFELSNSYQKLISQGVDGGFVTSLLKRLAREMDATSIKSMALVNSWIVGQLLRQIQVSENPFSGRYQVLLGSSAQGKTTTLVKMASHLVLKEKRRIAMVSLDTVKLGAIDQLRIFAQILNVPFAVVRTPQEWFVAEDKLKHVHYVLVDAPGLNLSTPEDVEWLKRMLPPAELNRQLHYVQSALARDDEAMKLAARYQRLGFHDAIFTRLDESGRSGLLLNFQQRFGVPIHSFGTGAKIPEDYELATKERIIDLILKLSPNLGREDNP